MIRYGGKLGTASSNVHAYSNGDDEHFSNERHYIEGIFTGYRWQCVEYARRWLLLRKTCIFRSIGSAADAWRELKSVERVTDGQTFPLIAHANGSAVFPKKDSLLIYSRCRDLPFGHIAVITDVGRDAIRIAEQNYYFRPWQGNYARQIPIKYDNGGFYLKDRYKIDGWMEIVHNDRLQPLDESAVEMIRRRQR